MREDIPSSLEDIANGLSAIAATTDPMAHNFMGKGHEELTQILHESDADFVKIGQAISSITGPLAEAMGVAYVEAKNKPSPISPAALTQLKSNQDSAPPSDAYLDKAVVFIKICSRHVAAKTLGSILEQGRAMTN